ncbi:hypothetical protein [Kitasatospora sp. NPDC058190]|uniref:hypothetical protein n=1 Tax=Kitasatospora sp. NPDC058190 TaxID=3346371 RepID=UPI0036D85982
MDGETARAVEELVGPNRQVRILGSGITDPWGGQPEDFARAIVETQKATAHFYVA